MSIVKKIYMFDFGWLGGDGGWFLPGWGAMTYSDKAPQRVWVEIPVTGVLMDTDIGYIVFDTGVAPNAWQTHTRGVLEAFPVIKFSDENRIEKQLNNLGLKPSDIAFVI